MAFNHCGLKVKRANEHIAELEKRIRTLPERCTAAMHMDTAGIHEVIKYDLPNPEEESDQIALLIGDVAHNLRCALDYAWISTLEKVQPSIIDGSTKFPVRESLESLESTLHGRKIDALVPKLYDLVTLHIRPYKGGNIAVWPLHQINNFDKHRLLIPLLNYSGIIDIEMYDDIGNRVPGFTWASTQPFPYYLHVPTGWTVKDKGKATISVMFDPITFGNEFRTTDSLRLYSGVVLQIAETLQGFTNS